MIDRGAFHTISYGLYVIASKLPDGRLAACVANTFQQVASDPAKVCVSLNKQNTTTEAAIKSGKYTANVLAQSSTMELIGVFGFKNSLKTDKFANVDFEYDASGMPCLMQSCVATFSVDIEQTVDVGSHMLLIGTVVEAKVLSDEKPLTYAYYHEVLRGKTPPKAASYVADDAAGDAGDATADAAFADAIADAVPTDAEVASEAAVKGSDEVKPKYAWQCTICGHIEYVDELPDDFMCPICGVGKELFERIEL